MSTGLDYSMTVGYFSKEELKYIKDLCDKVPYLSYVASEHVPCGSVLEEDVYAVDLFYYEGIQKE